MSRPLIPLSHVTIVNARIRYILMAEIGDAVASQAYIPSSFCDYAARYWVVIRNMSVRQRRISMGYIS